LLHRLRGGDETIDESAVEEDDNDSSNDVSVTSSEPITVDNSVVEAATAVMMHQRPHPSLLLLLSTIAWQKLIMRKQTKMTLQMISILKQLIVRKRAAWKK